MLPLRASREKSPSLPVPSFCNSLHSLAYNCVTPVSLYMSMSLYSFLSKTLVIGSRAHFNLVSSLIVYAITLFPNTVTFTIIKS